MKTLCLGLSLALAAPLAPAAPTPADLGDRLPVVMGAIVPLGQVSSAMAGQTITVEGRIVQIDGRSAMLQDNSGYLQVNWSGSPPAGVGRSVRVVGRVEGGGPYPQLSAQDSMVLLDRYQGPNRWSGLQSGVTPPPATTQIQVPQTYRAPATPSPPAYTPPQPPQTIGGYLPGQVPPGGWQQTNYGFPAPPPQLIQSNPVYGQINQEIWRQQNPAPPAYQNPSWAPTPPPGPPPSYDTAPPSQPLPQTQSTPPSSTGVVTPPPAAPPPAMPAGLPLAQVTSALAGQRVTVEGDVLSSLPGADNVIVLQDGSGTAQVLVQPSVTLLTGSRVRAAGQVVVRPESGAAQILADEITVLR